MLALAGRVEDCAGHVASSPDTLTQAIIQITTTGAEYARVNEIIDQIRSCTLEEIDDLGLGGLSSLWPRGGLPVLVTGTVKSRCIFGWAFQKSL